MLLQAQVYADKYAFILHHTDYRYLFNALQILCVRVFTCAADLQMDGEDGVGAGGLFVHQCVAHCPVPPSLLDDSLTLAHTVHGVPGEVPHVHTVLWMLFQLSVHQPRTSKTQHHPNKSPCSNTLTFKESCNCCAFKVAMATCTVYKHKNCFHYQEIV